MEEKTDWLGRHVEIIDQSHPYFGHRGKVEGIGETDILQHVKSMGMKIRTETGAEAWVFSDSQLK